MRRRIAFSLLFVALMFAVNLTAQCTYCAYRALSDTFSCQGTCSADAGCSGCCYIKREKLGEVCIAAGCCTNTPIGAVCYDQSGASCGAQPCQQGAVLGQISFANPLQNDPSSPSLTVLGTVKWIIDKNFPDKILKYSKSLGSAVGGWQSVVADSPESTVKEYDHRKFHMIVRPHFPVEVTVSHAGDDNWIVYLDRADTKLEGRYAPIMLEIWGNQWTLVSHKMAHSDDEEDEKYIVATGTVQ